MCMHIYVNDFSFDKEIITKEVYLCNELVLKFSFFVVI